MNRVSTLLNRINEQELILLITFIGGLIACQINYIQHGWINVDSTIYLEAAKLFAMGEWKNGLAIYNWPLYSLMIAGVSNITHLEIQTSAQLLDILFFTITVLSFTTFIKLAGGDKKTILCGAFLLFSSSYIVGSILPMLLRDQGFWAAFLSSLVFLIRFYRSQKIYDALLWQLFAITAVLFRIEAISYLVALPLILMIYNQKKWSLKISEFIKLNLISIISMIALSAALIFIPSLHVNNLGRLQEALLIFHRLTTETALAFSLKANIMGKQVLGYFFEEYGLMGVILTLLGIFIIRVVNIVSWPIIAIYILQFRNKNIALKIKPDTQKIMTASALIALTNGAVIISLNFILSNRYLIAFGFISLIFAAFCLDALINKNSKIWDHPWKKLLLILTLSTLAIITIKNVAPKKEGYNFERDAVYYLKNQNVQMDKVFLETTKMVYYATGQRKEFIRNDTWSYTQQSINDGSIFNYDYLLILLDVNNELRNREDILGNKLYQYEPIKDFYSLKNKKKIKIYRKKNTKE